VGFSPDGTQLVSGSSDNTLKLSSLCDGTDPAQESDGFKQPSCDLEANRDPWKSTRR